MFYGVDLGYVVRASSRGYSWWCGLIFVCFESVISVFFIVLCVEVEGS